MTSPIEAFAPSQHSIHYARRSLLVALLQRAFPKAQDQPAVGSQLVVDLFIALHIAAELLTPESRALPALELLIERSKAANPPSISVPEVSVHKNSNPLATEDNVRLSKGGPVIHTKAQAKREESSAKCKLRFAVSAANRGHDA